MFKSISFSILALVTCSVEAMTFNEPQEKPAVFQTIILKSDKTVFNNNFKNELTALPSDFSYDESSMKVESSFERFNKASISKQLSTK